MKYKQYRGYGHGWLVALTLSTHPAVFYGTIAAVGIVIGLLR